MTTQPELDHEHHILVLGVGWGARAGVEPMRAGGGQNPIPASCSAGDGHFAYSVWTPLCLRLDQYPAGVHPGEDQAGEAVSFWETG